MLRKILNVAGKPGLYRLVGSNKQMIIGESLVDGKRQPIYSRDRVMSVGDISMYTTEGDKPIDEILEAVRVKENGQKVDVKAVELSDEGLLGYFGEIVPEFDRDRVHASDVAKLLKWYNLLITAPEFAETFLMERGKAEEEATEEEPKAEEAKAEEPEAEKAE